MRLWILFLFALLLPSFVIADSICLASPPIEIFSEMTYSISACGVVPEDNSFTFIPAQCSGLNPHLCEVCSDRDIFRVQNATLRIPMDSGEQYCQVIIESFGSPTGVDFGLTSTNQFDQRTFSELSLLKQDTRSVICTEGSNNIIRSYYAGPVTFDGGTVFIDDETQVPVDLLRVRGDIGIQSISVICQDEIPTGDIDHIISFDRDFYRVGAPIVATIVVDKITNAEIDSFGQIIYDLIIENIDSSQIFVSDCVISNQGQNARLRCDLTNDPRSEIILRLSINEIGNFSYESIITYNVLSDIKTSINSGVISIQDEISQELDFEIPSGAVTFITAAHQRKQIRDLRYLDIIRRMEMVCDSTTFSSYSINIDGSTNFFSDCNHELCLYSNISNLKTSPYLELIQEEDGDIDFGELSLLREREPLWKTLGDGTGDVSMIDGLVMYLRLDGDLTDEKGHATFEHSRSGNPVFVNSDELNFDRAVLTGTDKNPHRDSNIRSNTCNGDCFWATPPENGTMSFWFSPSQDTSKYTAQQRIWGVNNNFECFISNNRLQCDLGRIDGTTNSFSYSAQNINWIAGEWYNVIITWKTVGDQVTYEIWYDGIVDSPVTGSGTAVHPGNSLCLGWSCGAGSGNRFMGRIDDVAFFNRTLSNDEILRLTSFPKGIKELTLGTNGSEDPFLWKSFSGQYSIFEEDSYINITLLFPDGTSDTIYLNEIGTNTILHDFDVLAHNVTLLITMSANQISPRINSLSLDYETSLSDPLYGSGEIIIRNHNTRESYKYVSNLRIGNTFFFDLTNPMREQFLGTPYPLTIRSGLYTVEAFCGDTSCYNPYPEIRPTEFRDWTKLLLPGRTFLSFHNQNNIPDTVCDSSRILRPIQLFNQTNPIEVQPIQP